MPLRIRHCVRCLAPLVLLVCATILHAQQLALQGLRSQGGVGQFNGLKSDAAGNLYTLFDAKDGVRLLKLDATGTQLLGEIQLGGAGDQAVALALDATGNIYVVGTSSGTGSVTGTAGVAFRTRADTTTNSFLIKFTPALVEQWLTFLGSGKMIVSGVDTTANQVVVTGSVYSATLPVTPNGIQQAPLPGSTGDGFVQGYATANGTLNYSTYLTGANGDTQPSSIAVDPSGNAYIAGTTSATGFPTLNAMVPTILSDSSNPVSGFLAKFTPAGDGILFSTYIPGNGILSAAFDAATNSVLLSGDVARGLFPITVVSGPIAGKLTYQTALRIPADGSGVTSATLLAPSNVSVIAASSTGFAATTTNLNVPNLPLLAVTPSESIGNAYLVQADSNGVPQQTARIGGLAATHTASSSLPAFTTGVAVSSSGTMTVAGGLAPTTSTTLLASQRYDFTAIGAPGTALPSSVHDAMAAAGTCNGSACTGGAGLLARLATSTSPQLGFSIDNLPNLVLRNTGSTDATGVQLTATGYTVTSTCAATLPAGSDCDIALAGSGPGSITASSGNSASATAALPANTATAAEVAVTPKELDFGIDSASSPARARTLTITNLTAQPQVFVSQSTALVVSRPGVQTQPYTVAENYAAGDCTPLGDGVHEIVAANATCHVVLTLTASSNAANDAAIAAAWTLGAREVVLTGYVQAAALSVSATHIGFGQQFNGGLRVPRSLFLSNGSDLSQSHTTVSLPSSLPFQVTDTCPTTLAPQSVCRIGITYNSSVIPSSDSTTLTLDNGLSVVIDGQTLAAQNVTGSSTNPNLTVTPTSVTFTSAVTVTTVSTETQTVTLKNAGATDFALTTTTSGDFATTACPATLTAGATCVVTLHFTPSASGTRTGLLTVTAGSSSPVYVTLSGQGTPITSTSPTNPTASPILNGTIDFGEQPVSAPATRWFKISSSFSSLTVASLTAEYGVLIVEDTGYGYGQPDRNAFKASVTGTCFNCYVGVQFLPMQTGARAGSLTLNTTGGGAAQTTALTGVGRPSTGVLFSPLVDNFGAVAMGSSSPTTAFVLTNATGAPITSGTATLTGDYSLSTAATGGTACGGTLANGESCVLAIQFTPTATGTRTGQVTVPTSSGSAVSTLTGTGSSSTGIGLQPTGLVFNNTPGTPSTTQTVTVTNSGSIAATVAAPSVNDSHFTAGTNCATLAAGASCTITVTYAPTASLAASILTLPVTTSPGGSAQTVTYQVALTGSYTQENAGLQIVPGESSTIHFGALATGSVSGIRVLRVNNLSAKAVTIVAQSPRQFPVVASTCGALAPGAGCTLSVAYAPITNGDTIGTLFLTGTPTDGSGTLNGLGYLEGYGLSTNVLNASGNFSPTGVLDFGQVGSGQNSTQTVTLTNRGGGTAGATAITVRRIHVDVPYTSTTTCGAVLAVNATCTVAITYAPTFQVTTGSTGNDSTANTGVLTVDTDAENGPFLIDLAGRAGAVNTVSPSNVAPVSLLALSQGALSFTGNTAVGTASASQAVTVSNAGTSVIHIMGVLTSADFTATSNCATLNPGDACTLNISFTPQSAGAHSSAVELQTDAATSLEFVSVLGTGLPASVTLAPTTLDFGSVLLGRTSALSTTFTNTGTTSVTLGALTTSGDYSIASATTASTPCSAGTVLASGASCSIAIVFSPTQTGPRPGTLSVANSATALPLTATLTGIGAQSQLTATPNGLTFGDVLTGKTAQLSLTLSNGSATDVNGLTFSITGDYAVTSTCGPGTLRAGSACSITVAFTPTAAGARTGTLTINSSDPTSPLLVPLTGNGTQAGAFTLTANGGAVASASEPVAIPASYTLAVTPNGGFTGPVALTCTPQGTYAYISCSISPSTVTLSNGAQTSIATITTVTGTAVTSLRPPASSFGSTAAAIAACLLAPCVLMVRQRRILRIPLLMLLGCIVFSAASGCGSGTGDKRIRYGAPGTYQFIVTASSTTGIPVSQSATLNLTITN